MRPAWQSAWKSPTRRPAWSARATTRRRRCTCIIWRGWIWRRPWEKSGAWCNEEAYRHHSGAGGGGRGGLDLPRKRKEARQPDCGLGEYRADRSQYRVQDGGPADRAHGGRRRRREEGASDRAAGPRSTGGATPARNRGPGIGAVATGSGRDLARMGKGYIGRRHRAEARGCGGQRGAAGGVAERGAAPGEAGRAGGRGLGAIGSGPFEKGLGPRADAFQGRRYLGGAVRSISQPLGERHGRAEIGQGAAGAGPVGAQGRSDSGAAGGPPTVSRGAQDGGGEHARNEAPGGGTDYAPGGDCPIH